MGMLTQGQWQDVWYDTKASGGNFVRSQSQWRHWITPQGEPGPSGDGGFPAAKNRYHLYVSLACPWAHRTLVMRQLKALTQVISVSAVHPLMLENGWTFDRNFPHADGDPLYGLEYLYQLYLKADPQATTRVTVPVLWDKYRQTIVSNESADIMRMLNSAFTACGARDTDYYPLSQQKQIDQLNDWIYSQINNGVYRAGFATTQQAYDNAVSAVFDGLERAEAILAERRYLTGNQLSEADIRLWTTLIRFDDVYVTHFKCNRKRISDYPNLYGFLRDIYQLPGIADTVNLPHICHHYYASHRQINPSGIIPVGPDHNWWSAHHRVNR
ncbi:MULTISPECIES: glutathione S-transferase family protein [unclassified Tatumella]|uniref:glutathione S-transferase family protein n=1 Tax=unclassified Tatumella TaxID=2649542 RepID=UPI001BAF6E34|nr:MULTISPECIES: glutathione S-transferase family protein [unclassified Tatumella]MBS0876767.1 glutathione S-transferase family protein [Tatumella sp. JGM82]MBS0889808.1 glutathione S-transferase family protein [Tatumella sp. JGM94]MBS0901522.1 glutathione S-transferase family protein [Tatumella sp. JGM100]